tara:strand:+ start:430 stop:795 length:366 start_codon:yes stop_codon:yes gene_type:complete
MSIYTKNQNKDKLRGCEGYIGSLTCYYNDDRQGKNIQLTSLEEGWYSHEETINHPEGSEYPTEVNEPFRKLMADRVADSVLNRTGINIRDFDNIIHASSHPARDKQGNIIDHGNENLVRNV